MGPCQLRQVGSQRSRPRHTRVCHPGYRRPGNRSRVVDSYSTHPLLWFTRYHHSLHNLGFALVVGVVAFAIATRRWATGLLALASFHVHLFEDVLGSRGPDGYQWPIPYLQPFSSSLQLAWRGEWGLNAWHNIALSFILLMITFWLWRRGFSPLEMISAKADSAFVGALRRRFPRGSEAA